MTAIAPEPVIHRAPALQLEVVQPRAISLIPPRPKLKKAQIPKLVYAIALMVMRTACYDMRWNQLAHKLSEHKFRLFPELRRWQIHKWVAQFRRQNLFPNATESELRTLARDFVAGFMI
jgi:hypothetical protein